MQFIREKLSTLVRPVRFVLTACICALLVFAYVTPAFAAGGYPTTAGGSSPTKGEDQLLQIERKSQEAATSDPYSMEKTKSEANAGLNEIQGDADAEKMYRPGNTQGASSIEEKVQTGLEKVTGAINK